MAQEDSRQEGRRAERWARVNFPNKFVHPHAADKVAAWAECWEVDDPRVLAGVAVRSAADPTNMAVTAAESGRAL